MEVNLNCDLGEKSIHYNGKNDFSLLKIINTANIACGYHAGNLETIRKTIKEAKINNVSVGAHPGFNDLKNFGRKKIYLAENKIREIIRRQIEIISQISLEEKWKISHVKLHGSLNNMACENFDIAFAVGEEIKKFDNNLIYVILPFTEMEKAAQKINIKYAYEIFVDRNYLDNGHLIPRSNINSLIDNPITIGNNIIEMLEQSSIKCLSGKKIKCNIDTLCIHGDTINSVKIANNIKNILKKNNINITNLNKLKKFL